MATNRAASALSSASRAWLQNPGDWAKERRLIGSGPGARPRAVQRADRASEQAVAEERPVKSFDPELGRLKALGRYRSLQLPAGLDLSSNDYLGLAEHPALRQAAIEALQGGIEIGASASRLLRGHRRAHAELESFAAEYFDCPRTLFFANGYQANFALITALVKRDDTIVFDALCHASMRDGIYTVRCGAVKIPHNDLDAFERALKAPRAAGATTWILVESVYSMEGDIAPLAALLALAEKYDAMLIVDEAHGTGVCGASGRGATEGLSSGHERLIVLHTCGKALGVAGALVCASETVIDYLINAARPFVYSTAPMPLQAVLVQRALSLVQEESYRLAELAALKAHAARCLPGVPVTSQIVPIIIGGDDAAVALAGALQAEGFDIRAIRPPTVPEGTARLRLSLRVGVSHDQLSGFAEALARLRRQRLSA
jgi:8-amino-7-oxononanoate synthase